MSGAELTILLPDRADASWVDIVRARFGTAVEAMARSLGLPRPSLVVTRQGSEAVLLAGPSRYALDAGPTPHEIAAVALSALTLDHWGVLMAPALAARGIGERWWLRHAARRGLTVDELADLARDNAPEDHIAWRLAAAHAPTITLMAGRDALATLADIGFRKAVAAAAAAQACLPIPIPGDPVADPLLDDHEAVVMIGALRSPSVTVPGIGALFGILAPALLDPALAIALLTDEARIPVRLGTLALTAPGPVAVARGIHRALETEPWPLDLVSVVESEAGLAPPQ